MKLFIIAVLFVNIISKSDGYSERSEPDPVPDMNSFIESVEQSEPGSLDEQLTSLTIHVDGTLATAWMDYDFFYAGEFSHCGVNSMNLVNTGSGWKIFSIVDTRRQENC